MALSLVKRIARIRSAIDVETDPGKLEPLQTRLALALALASASKDDDDEDDKDDKDDDGEESKAKKAAATAAKAKKSAEAAKHRAKAAEHKAKAAESEEAAKKCEEGEEEEESEEAKKAAALVTTGGHDALLASLSATVARVEQTQLAGAKMALLAGAFERRAITRAEKAELEAQPLAFVETFLRMRAKGGHVVTDEEHLLKPKDAKPGTEASLPDYTREMIDASVAAFPGADKKAFRETLVKAHLEEHVKQLAAANSAPGRY